MRGVILLAATHRPCSIKRVVGSEARGDPVKLKITTWNINSVRHRRDLVKKFLIEHQPDILCLQETKCRDSEFPESEIRKLGYEHIAINGQKGYHGVAIISRLPFDNIEKREFCLKGDARHLAVTLPVSGRKIRVHNFYIPAGGDDPDPQANDKFAHKLGFLDEMHRWTMETSFVKADTILLGDFNVAPYENDVWSHKALLKVVSHTPIETEKLAAILKDGDWIDVLRRFTPMEQKLYTWWSYRARDWANADKGRRLDHIWASRSLEPALTAIEILREARGWEGPSDHVPVSAVLQF
jgi:exodeoxyribonuclease-3